MSEYTRNKNLLELVKDITIAKVSASPDLTPQDITELMQKIYDKLVELNSLV